MMSNMIIKVEFLAGTNIKDAVEEAKQKAEKLDLAYVEFDFNGISFSIGRNADVLDVWDQYQAGIQAGIEHIASA